MSRWNTDTNPLGLTDRQMEAIEAYWKLGTLKEVEAALGLSQPAVCRLLEGVMQKTNTRNRTHAVLQWERLKAKRGTFTGQRTSVFDLGAQQ